MAVTDIYALSLARSMPLPQQNAFFAAYQQRVKSYSTTLVLAIFLGLFGAHKFYLGKNGQALVHIACTVFGLVITGLVLLIVDVIRLRRTVEKVNRHIAEEIAAQVRLTLPTAS